MKNSVATGQVEAHKERGLSSPRQSFMAGWETCPPVIDAEAWEIDKMLQENLEKSRL